MGRGDTNVESFLLAISRSMSNVGYRNDHFIDFVRSLLTGRVIQATYISARTPPGEVAAYLDLMIICGPPRNGTLIMITPRRTGAVDWQLISLANCIGASVSVVGGLAIGRLQVGGLGVAQFADDASEEAGLNGFFADIARLAWGF